MPRRFRDGVSREVVDSCERGGWKHMPPQQLRAPEAARALSPHTWLRRNRTAGKVLAIVRNPLAQIVGWSKSPYDLASCVQNRNRNTGADWVERQCRFTYSVPRSRGRCRGCSRPICGTAGPSVMCDSMPAFCLCTL